jgi:hypothetical protein
LDRDSSDPVADGYREKDLSVNSSAEPERVAQKLFQLDRQEEGFVA